MCKESAAAAVAVVVLVWRMAAAGLVTAAWLLTSSSSSSSEEISEEMTMTSRGGIALRIILVMVLGKICEDGVSSRYRLALGNDVSSFLSLVTTVACATVL